MAVCVRLPMMRRPVAVPVMAKLVIKDTMPASRLRLARRMVTRLSRELPGRTISVTADSAYAGEELKQLPAAVTWTTRLRVNAALCGLPPQSTGKKGLPRVKGTGSPPWPRSPPRQRSPRSGSPGTARGKPSPCTPSPACGTPYRR
jgi:hypothetical protein